MIGEIVYLKRTTLAGVALVLALMDFPWSGQLIHPLRAQEEATQCAEGDGWLECRAAAGDPLAKYQLGRTAYENARGTGDFSEPLRIGRELAAQNDPNGKRLLKMTHLQLSWGNHKDYVQAYVWLVEDQQAGFDYVDKLVVNLSKKMTPQQLAEAKVLTGQ